MSKKHFYNFMDPGTIMATVVALLILSVGVFAFFVTLEHIPTTNQNETETYANTTSPEDIGIKEIMEPYSNSNTLINILGLMAMVIGILGVVYYAHRCIVSYERNRGWEDKRVVKRKKKTVDVPELKPVDKSSKTKESREKTKSKSFKEFKV